MENPFFLILFSDRMKKKLSVLEITLDVESKDYLECLQANLRFLLYERKKGEDQLKLFFLDKCKTRKTSAKFSIEIPEEPFSDKVSLEAKKITIKGIIEPSFLFDYYDESDEEELETFLLCVR